MTRRLLPVLLAVGLLTGCASAPTEPLRTSGSGDQPPAERARELAAARERWQSAGAADYVADVELECYCPHGVYRVSVRDGRVADTRPLTPGGAESGIRLDLSVEGLFAQVEEHLEAAVLDVEYDARSGYPAVLRIDPLANAIDDEVGFEVHAYTPHPR